ncbi:MAG TPA: penicillin-binding protein 2 [Actinomycetota bacterium]|nr:penicillin-binding protein 2 [Actinomycetota bacterium]
MHHLGARRRASAMLALILILLLAIGLRLAVVQAVQAEEFSAKAKQQRLRHIELPARRGAIYDRDGRELAISIPARTIFANPKQITDPAGVARALAPILGLDVEELTSRLERKDRGFVYLARRVDVDAARRVEELDLVGIGLVEEARRIYPGGPLGANIMGFVGTDAKGLSGLESTFEEMLGGQAGWRQVELDPKGRRIAQGVFHEKPPVPGADLVLTIDRELQFAAERALRKAVEETDAAGGSVVALDPRTGEILAMANSPTFDPNDLSTVEEGATRNRAVTDVFEPGSVSKVITAAGALEEGVVTRESTYGVASTIRLAGRVFSDAHEHAPKTMTFERIIAESSNVGTIKVAQALGAERLERYMSLFGYGQPTGLGFPGESAGILPSATRWSTSLPTMAIGQGVSATGLQLAKVFATVANGGVSLQPSLVSGWVDAEGELHRSSRGRAVRVVSEETSAVLREILTSAVEDGTGTRARIEGYRVAGKTGTAQKVQPGGGYKGYMASFIGFFPSDAPRIVISVTLDEPSPYYGGIVSAPVFREVGQAAVRILRIPPAEPTREAQPDPQVRTAGRETERLIDGPGPAGGGSGPDGAVLR